MINVTSIFVRKLLNKVSILSQKMLNALSIFGGKQKSGLQALEAALGRLVAECYLVETTR